MKIGVAIGSNLGDRLANLKQAVTELQRLSRLPVRKSSVYESTPVDCPPGSPKFLNAVVELDVDDPITPRGLLGKLQEIERKLGRETKQIHNEARPIDLDLIYWDERRIQTDDLVVPHPRAHRRRFVLQPLSDLSPNLGLPGQTRSIGELLAALDSDETVIRFTDCW